MCGPGDGDPVLRIGRRRGAAAHIDGKLGIHDKEEQWQAAKCTHPDTVPFSRHGQDVRNEQEVHAVENTVDKGLRGDSFLEAIDDTNALLAVLLLPPFSPLATRNDTCAR